MESKLLTFSSSYGLFNILQSDMINVHKFLARVELFLQYLLTLFSTKFNRNYDDDDVIITCIVRNMSVSSNNDNNNIHQGARDHHEMKPQEALGTGEISMVMGRLGISCDDLDGDHGAIINDDVLLSQVLFDDHSFSLEAGVQDTFDVFDKNKDGFIDDKELLIVLSALGLQHGLEDCRRMINGFDQNGDGLIDFKEFVRLMDYCFSC